MKKKFPYHLESLSWDKDHQRNIENKYCYCGKGFKENQPMIRCDNCKQLFHRGCIKCMEKPLLFGDTFGSFHCSVCNKGPETFERKSMSWIIVVHLVLYNLIRNAEIDNAKKTKREKRDHFYFRWKEDVCAFIDDYWDYLVPDKHRTASWHNTIASVLSTHSNIFLSGFEKFQQSAWWTLQKIEPPSNEKKSKQDTTRVKPNLRKPLKRLNADKEQSKRNAKKIKKEYVPELLSKPEQDSESDMLDLSSLSELSSAEESMSENEDEQRVTIKETNEQPVVDKSPELANKSKEISPVKEPSPSPPLASPSPASKELPLPREVPASNSKLSTPDQPSYVREPSPHISEVKLESTPANEDIFSIDNMYPTTTSSKDKIPCNHTSIVSKQNLTNTASSRHNNNAINNNNNSNKSTNNAILTPQEEWVLLQKLEHSSKKLSPAARRLRRKLAIRRLKRNLGLKLFDIDSHVLHLLRTTNHVLEPISSDTIIQPASNQHVEQHQQDGQQLLDKITYTPYTSSFASRLLGSIRQRHTITRDEPWLSSWNGRKLRPFIRRDFQSKPKRMLLMGQIKACGGKPGLKPEPSGIVPGESIDYVYFQKEHLTQVNQLLCRSFWEGVDVSESLLFPEFSIVALYKRCVIGCAFMTPEAYITYFAVEPGWMNASIGQFMLYHLFQTAISKDITLHVSANNNAMILYQKFGFKPEEFIVNFYDKYLPSDSVFSKNAFFLRLRR